MRFGTVPEPLWRLVAPMLPAEPHPRRPVHCCPDPKMVDGMGRVVIGPGGRVPGAVMSDSL